MNLLHDGRYSPDDHFSILYENNNLHDLAVASTSRGKYDVAADFIEDLMASRQVRPDLTDQLADYVSKIESNTKSLEEIKDLILGSLHSECIDAICDHLILKKDKKINTVFLLGRTDTGKTELLNRL